ncbi:MAG: hypothetical protein M3122_09665, partial [Actinomycetota bacterium]|nr:hypothetical protein [Actinomycetota bacterium]
GQELRRALVFMVIAAIQVRLFAGLAYASDFTDDFDSFDKVGWTKGAITSGAATWTRTTSA